MANFSKSFFLFLILLGKIIYIFIYDLHYNPYLFPRFLAFPIFFFFFDDFFFFFFFFFAVSSKILEWKENPGNEFVQILG